MNSLEWFARDTFASHVEDEVCKTVPFADRPRVASLAKSFVAQEFERGEKIHVRRHAARIVRQVCASLGGPSFGVDSRVAKADLKRLTDLKINEVSLVDRAANKRTFVLAKRDTAGKVTFCSRSSLRIAKDASGKHEVIGVVLEDTTDPRVGADSQDEIYDAQAVADACDNFAGGMGLQHTQAIVAGARITRSWIQLSDDFSLGAPIYVNSWVMRWEITDPNLWQKIVDGEVSGFSVGGTATVSAA